MPRHYLTSTTEKCRQTLSCLLLSMAWLEVATLLSQGWKTAQFGTATQTHLCASSYKSPHQWKKVSTWTFNSHSVTKAKLSRRSIAHQPMLVNSEAQLQHEQCQITYSSRGAHLHEHGITFSLWSCLIKKLEFASSARSRPILFLFHRPVRRDTLFHFHGVGGRKGSALTAEWCWKLWSVFRKMDFHI